MPVARAAKSNRGSRTKRAVVSSKDATEITRLWKESNKQHLNLQQRLIILARGPISAARSHAEAKANIFYALTESMRALHNLKDVHDGIKNAVMRLHDGMAQHRSLPCAILLASFVGAIGEAMPEIVSQFDHLMLETQNVEETLWGDPLTETPKYTEPADAAYGDEIRGETAEERIANGVAMLKEKILRIKGLKVETAFDSVKSMQLSGKAATYLIDAIRSDPTLIPGRKALLDKQIQREEQLKLRKSFLQGSADRAEAVKARRVHVVVLKPSGANDGALEKENMEEKKRKVKAILVGKLKDVPLEKRSQVLNDLMFISTEHLKKLHMEEEEVEIVLAQIKAHVEQEKNNEYFRLRGGQRPPFPTDEAADFEAFAKELDMAIEYPSLEDCSMMLHIPQLLEMTTAGSHLEYAGEIPFPGELPCIKNSGHWEHTLRLIQTHNNQEAAIQIPDSSFTDWLLTCHLHPIFTAKDDLGLNHATYEAAFEDFLDGENPRNVLEKAFDILSFDNELEDLTKVQDENVDGHSLIALAKYPRAEEMTAMEVKLARLAVAANTLLSEMYEEGRSTKGRLKAREHLVTLARAFTSHEVLAHELHKSAKLPQLPDEEIDTSTQWHRCGNACPDPERVEEVLDSIHKLPLNGCSGEASRTDHVDFIYSALRMLQTDNLLSKHDVAIIAAYTAVVLQRCAKVVQLDLGHGALRSDALHWEALSLLPKPDILALTKAIATLLQRKMPVMKKFNWLLRGFAFGRNADKVFNAVQINASGLGFLYPMSSSQVPDTSNWTTQPIEAEQAKKVQARGRKARGQNLTPSQDKDAEADAELASFVNSLVDHIYDPQTMLHQMPKAIDAQPGFLDKFHSLLARVSICMNKVRDYKIITSALEEYSERVRSFPSGIDRRFLYSNSRKLAEMCRGVKDSLKEVKSSLKRLRMQSIVSVEAAFSCTQGVDTWMKELEKFLSSTERGDRMHELSADALVEGYRNFRRLLSQSTGMGHQIAKHAVQMACLAEASIVTASQVLHEGFNRFGDNSDKRMNRTLINTTQKHLEDLLEICEEEGRQRLAEELMADEAKLSTAVLEAKDKQKRKKKQGAKPKAASWAQQSKVADTEAVRRLNQEASPVHDSAVAELKRREARNPAVAACLDNPMGEEDWTDVPSTKKERKPRLLPVPQPQATPSQEPQQQSAWLQVTHGEALPTPPRQPQGPAAVEAQSVNCALPNFQADRGNRGIRATVQDPNCRSNSGANAPAALEGRRHSLRAPRHDQNSGWSSRDEVWQERNPGWQDRNPGWHDRNPRWQDKNLRWQDPAHSSQHQNVVWQPISAQHRPGAVGSWDHLLPVSSQPDAQQQPSTVGGWEAGEVETPNHPAWLAADAEWNAEDTRVCAEVPGPQPKSEGLADRRGQGLHELPRGCLACKSYDGHSFYACHVYHSMLPNQQEAFCKQWGMPYRSRRTWTCYLCREPHRFSQCPRVPAEATREECSRLFEACRNRDAEERDFILGTIYDRLSAPRQHLSAPSTSIAERGERQPRGEISQGFLFNPAMPGSWAAIAAKACSNDLQQPTTDARPPRGTEQIAKNPKSDFESGLAVPRPPSAEEEGPPSPPARPQDDRQWQDDSQSLPAPIVVGREVSLQDWRRLPAMSSNIDTERKVPREERSRQCKEYMPPWPAPSFMAEHRLPPALPPLAPPIPLSKDIQTEPPLATISGCDIGGSENLSRGYPPPPTDARATSSSSARVPPPGFPNVIHVRKSHVPQAAPAAHHPPSVPIETLLWADNMPREVHTQHNEEEQEDEGVHPKLMEILGVDIGDSASNSPAEQYSDKEDEPWEEADQPFVVPHGCLDNYSNVVSAPFVEAHDDEAEDEELQRALQASLDETQQAVPQRMDGVQNTLQMSDVATPGLQNNAGEYNCFLNSIIQCLWHCQDLRSHLQRWDTSEVQGNAVVSALVELFHDFAAEEAEQASAGARKIITVAALRHALHSWNEERFRMGEMSDAAEVLSAIYDSLCSVADGQQMVSDLFEFQVHQYIDCPACNKRSHDSHHSQFFYHTSATALREEAGVDVEQDGIVASLGTLLSRVERQQEKTCDIDIGGCGRRCTITEGLKARSMPARLFTIQLGWEHEQEAADTILDTLASISEEVDVAEVFTGGKKPTMYELRCMVCYYGLHYFAFVKDQKNGLWRMFDDAMTSEIGDWEDVRRKCHSGRIQPLILFYEALWSR